MKFRASAIAIISMIFMTSVYASEDVQKELDYKQMHELPQDMFNEIADKMKFNPLREFALQSKPAKDKVKKYFDYRISILKYTKCPTLT